MIKVIPLKFYDGGYMVQSFAFGGTRAKEDCEDIKYPASLQNYLIDDGKDVILSDTGFAEEMKDFSEDDGSLPLYMGKKIASFKKAFEKMGYKIEDVTKILVTHKHPDHIGELRMFPNAKIYISEREADDMGLTGDNVVRVKFTDGAYKNFPESQRITDSLVMIKAVGHTEGNSIYILEDKEEDLYYMFHGDVTYCDAALIAHELSIADENKLEARKTADRIREFIKNNRTIYCSTHCPQGYQAVENKTVMVLNDEGERKTVKNINQPTEQKGWKCKICGYVYEGETLPDDFRCPVCGQGKEEFEKLS